MLMLEALGQRRGDFFWKYISLRLSEVARRTGSVPRVSPLVARSWIPTGPSAGWHWGGAGAGAGAGAGLGLGLGLGLGWGWGWGWGAGAGGLGLKPGLGWTG